MGLLGFGCRIQPWTRPAIPLRPKPSLRGCSNAASRFGPTLPLVWARPSTWQEPHLATNICLPAMRLGLPPSVRVEQALSTTAHAPTTAIATAARRRLMDRTGPIGARLYPLRRTGGEPEPRCAVARYAGDLCG